MIGFTRVTYAFFMVSHYWLFGRILLASVFLTYAMNGVAQEPEIPKTSDVRLVIDVSGSMKKNDPQNLRRPALDMLVQLLPKGSKAGIWTFGQYVNMIVPHELVTSRWGNKAVGASSKVKSIAQFTNIGEALEKAAYDAQQDSGSFQRHVILLTDGMVDIDRDSGRNRQERQRIINSVLPIYESAGITLHTIALSDNADKALLNKLALKTDGKAAVAKTAEELMNAFLQVFNQAVPLEEAIFDGESFVVDSSIEEFTALIFRKPNAKNTEIAGPDGTVYSSSSNDSTVTWHHTDKYDMITITQPLEGEWKVSADVEPQSRVTVVSDLSIAIGSMPTNLALNESVKTTLALREENKTITRLEFLGLLDIDANVSGDNGKQWSQRLSKNLVPEDGLYPVLLDQFDQEGQYTITFVVDGKSFKRQYTHQLSVRKPFLVDVEKSQKNGVGQFVIKVTPQSKDINVQQTSIVGKLKDPDGVSEQLPFIITEDEAWMLLVSPEKAGDYLLSVTVKGTNGVSDIPLETIRLSQEGGSSSVLTKEPDPVVDEVEEVVTEAAPEPIDVPEEGVDMMSILLYGVIAVVNLLIIGLGYFAYRKFFKKSADDEDEGQGLAGEGEDIEGFMEPPMDDMAVEDIEDEDDVKEESSESVEEPQMDDSDVSQAETEEEAFGDEPEEEEVASESGDQEEMGELDLDDDEDIPDFSLDEFSADSLDEEDLLGDDEEKEKE